MTASPSRLRSVESLPGPPGWPLIGNALDIDVTRLHLRLEAWVRDFGEIYAFRIGRRRFVVISALEPALTVLKERPQKFRRFSQIEHVLEEMGGNGVFSTEGSQWQKQRRLVTKALTPRQIENAFPEFQTITRRLMQRWQLRARAGRASDVIEDLTRYTVDTTMALLFGVDINTLETDGQVIQEHIHHILPMVNWRINAPLPYWRYVKLPGDRRLDTALESLQRFLDGLIDDARRRLASPDDGKRSLLEAMVALCDEPESEFDDRDLRANIITLLLTGEDTTAYSLAWAIDTLAADAAMQDQLRERVSSACGGKPIPASLEQLAALDYIEGFSLEVMRRRPPAPLISMEANEDVVLAGTAIPKGTPLLLLTRPSSLDDRFFADPAGMNCARWLPGEEAVSPHDTRAFLHFGAGPRFCPGRYLAIVEMKLVLAMLTLAV